MLHVCARASQNWPILVLSTPILLFLICTLFVRHGLLVLKMGSFCNCSHALFDWICRKTYFSSDFGRMMRTSRKLEFVCNRIIFEGARHAYDCGVGFQRHKVQRTARDLWKSKRCAQRRKPLACKALQHEKRKCTRGLSCAQGIVVYAPENMGIVCVWSVVRNNLVWTRHKKTPRGNFMVVRSEWPLWFLNRGYSMTSSSRIIAMDSRLWFYHEVSTPKLSYFQEFGRLSCVLFFVSH